MNETFLYQNAAKSVTVLDLPRSIEYGQGSQKWLMSTAAPDIPYPSTEPKGQKREKLLSEIPEVERTYHHRISELLKGALEEARKSIGDRDWCYARNEQHTLGRTPQLAFDDGDNDEGLPRAVQPPFFLSSNFENYFSVLTDLRYTLVVNALATRPIVVAEAHSFIVPPRSAFLYTTIANGIPLLNEALASTVFSTDSTSIGGYFDFVLLDPPWPNRSVRHSHTYRTAETQDDPFEEVLPILQAHVAPHGIIAIWITNKAAIRSRVLRALSDIGGFELFAEYIWLKITTKGEPVTNMDGVWRKPYEVLLLLTRSTVAASSNIQQQVIIAVPDLHSRKPCMKQLIEPLLSQPYHALEIFARSLTAGWWSWGEECLNYQHSSHWSFRTNGPRPIPGAW